MTNADGDAKANVALGSGAGRPARIQRYPGKDFAGGGELAATDLAPGSGAGRPARIQRYPGKDFAGGGELAATDLDIIGGAVLADGVYVG